MSPDPFLGIIGHEAACGLFLRTLEKGQLPHAFLFIGPEGVGKEAVARRLIHAFLGGSIEAHPDFLFIERLTDEKTKKLKTQISVDQIREVKDKLALSSFSGKKAVLIRDADRMPPSAANALLKTLEEPRGDVLIILLGGHEASLLATIASRCQVVRFHPVPTRTIAEALKKYVGSAAEAEYFARLSFGRPGLALLLAQDAEYREGFLAALEEGGKMIQSTLPARLKLISRMLPKEEANKAAIFFEAVSVWEQAVRDQMLASIGCRDLMTVAQAPVVPPAPFRWISVMRAIQEAREAAAQNGNPQLGLEHAAIAFPS